jgi:hypothetical protein
MGRILMDMDDGQPMGREWYGKITAKNQGVLRRKIRRLMDALMRHLADTSSDADARTGASEVGRDFAESMWENGVTLVETVRGFTLMHRFIIEAMIQLSETGGTRSLPEWGQLLKQVYAFTNEVLLSIIEYYQAR